GDSGSTTNGSSSKSDSGSATNDSSAKDTGATASETEKKDPAGQQSTEISNAYARFSVSSLPLQIGKKSDALTQALSYAAGDRIISWSSNKPKVVEVNKITGQIRAKKKGSAVITVTLASGKTASCKIKTQKKPVKTKKLSVESKNLQLGKGSRYQLTVARTPLTASDKLTFTSSNKKVIKVNGKGQLKALKKGSAKITVRSANGKKLVIKVKVK
ncbi:MAG: Ig-like domain-containing protein, partial [Eubacteriales bacterium]|nr:Ig-like domain-containing protein [Eubacteriales bacterium]